MQLKRSFNRYFARMKPSILFGSSVMVVVILIAAVAFSSNADEVPGNRLELVLRDVGHQLLLTAKDSTSRVMPVKKLNETTYQISFQSDFSFISDSLIDLVQRTFKKNALASDYIVNLRNCQQNETVFAFEINSHAGNLTPCRGRKLEVGCYVIDIEFLRSSTFNYYWLLLLVIPLGMIGFYVRNKSWQKEQKKPVADNDDYVPLGSLKFYPADNVVKSGDTGIELSEKETKALKIFAAHINQVVEREKLMKEIWEDEGVVVISRNVDVLVSKLRKKLAGDDSIKFINVHGKGYKFVIE